MITQGFLICTNVNLCVCCELFVHMNGSEQLKSINLPRKMMFTFQMFVRFVFAVVHHRQIF